NANILGVKFEKHNYEFDGTDGINSNHKKEINKCKLLVIESELTILRGNKAYINSDESRKTISNQKSARNIDDDPKDSINGNKAPDSRAIIVNNEIGNSKGICEEKRKFKYHYEYKFYDKKSCHDECPACDYRLVEIERNKKG
ncbi:22081_t:CDS:1, partial [Gigaspora margarita]